MKNFTGKKIAILGFGLEGEAAADFLVSQGSIVTVFDRKEEEEFEQDKVSLLSEKGVDFEFGSETADFASFDILVRSPGISPLSPVIVEAKKQGVLVTSATKIFFDLSPAKIIGVTGTKGKGTTSALIYELLKKQGIDAYLGGNIGTPALSFFDKLSSSSIVVLELSSFQLQDLDKSPHIAVVLMITSEHLDYHKDVMEYVEAKRNILRFQNLGDFVIINRDYPASNESDIHTEAKVYFVSRVGEVREGCYLNKDFVYLRINGEDKNVISIRDILLPGKHNLENVCAATMAAWISKVDLKNIKQVLREFKGLEHRLELARTVGGVRYYDDSFSTTPETAAAAIEAFDSPEILILGGSSKNSDFSDLGKIISSAKNIKAIIGIGEEWPTIKSKIKDQKSKIEIIEGCKNMHEIVRAASDAAEIGDVVLLSPACASFDMFNNYKERGEQFKEEVQKLI